MEKKAEVETWVSFGDGTIYELAGSHKVTKLHLQALIKANPQAECLLTLYDRYEVSHNDMLAYIVKSECPILEVYTNGTYIELFILH